MSQVTASYIEGLENHIAEMKLTQPGDTVRLRVAQSHGKPVCAHIDIYRDGVKHSTAGREHRVNFATRGITVEWEETVKAGVEAAYGKSTSIQRKDSSRIDNEHVHTLENHIAGMNITQPGDTVRLRVAQSHGKPVCAHIDLYRNESKIGTAGREHRVNFATRGITAEWEKAIKAGVEAAYLTLQQKPRTLVNAYAEVVINGSHIERASGTIDGLLALLEPLMEPTDI